MEKEGIVGILGERGLLLPNWVDEGLAANERAKCLFALLQMARWAADRPDQPRPDLEAEKQACGLSGAWLDTLVANARATEAGYVVPGADRLVRQIFAEIDAMLRPVLAAEDPPGDDANALAGRLESLRRDLSIRGSRIDPEEVARIASVDHGGADSLHRLVMDLHKRLSLLQASLASTSIDGAATRGLNAEDAVAVRAFMRGLAETAPLKFDHPGLGTNASRLGGRLTIQNDIGTTDAHVLVIHVETLSVTITYTDVHAERLAFFREMFADFAVDWHRIESRCDDRIGEEGIFHLSVGTFAAPDRPALEVFLAHLGSRLVFLIDWNKARKRLRQLLPRGSALALLHWAAANRCGHRGFLLLGGEKLIFDTLTVAARAPLPYGARLDEMLGEEEAADYLRFLFRLAAEGLLAGRPEALLREEARAELIIRLGSSEDVVMGIIGAHAAEIEACAGILRDAVRGWAEGVPAPAPERLARDAKAREGEADRLLVRARALVRRSGGAPVLRALAEEADDAIDAIEEAAFLLSLPQATQAKPAAPLLDLADLVPAAAADWRRAIAGAARIRRGTRADMQAFLEAVEAIIGHEHRGDQAEREAKAALLAEAGDFRQFTIQTDIAAHLEDSSDALMRAALMLRDHVLSDVIAG